MGTTADVTPLESPLVIWRFDSIRIFRRNSQAEIRWAFQASASYWSAALRSLLEQRCQACGVTSSRDDCDFSPLR